MMTTCATTSLTVQPVLGARLSWAVAALAITVAMLPSPARAEASADALVDALNAVFGKHDGVRSGHANGICVKGTFTPSPEASTFSKARHFGGSGPYPVVGRFSMGGGNPKVPNTKKDVVRGLAIHIDLENGNTTDMVLISAPVFPARTPEQFLSLLETVATKDADKIAAFFKANPESARQAAYLNARPVPASYATTTYHGVHTFTLTNGDGSKKIIKWKVAPKGGDVGLSDDEAKLKAADFYTPELTERLASGAAEFELQAVIGSTADPVDDPTSAWSDDGRTHVPMGVFAITALEENAVCNAGMFDPTLLTDGIDGPANDAIFAIRSSAYAISLSRRSN